MSTKEYRDNKSKQRELQQIAVDELSKCKMNTNCHVQNLIVNILYFCELCSVV